MNTKDRMALIADAVEIADRLADTGADEFTQWLGAFYIMNQPRNTFTEAEIWAAWEHFQAFKATLPDEN
jgi:tRNA A22 N-methylase